MILLWNLQGIEVFYDGRCGMCCSFHEWISCANYQAAARKLGGPGLLPVAIHACRVLAANRHALSKVFFRSKDKRVREELHQMVTAKCTDNFCAVK